MLGLIPAAPQYSISCYNKHTEANCCFRIAPIQVKIPPPRPLAHYFQLSSVHEIPDSGDMGITQLFLLHAKSRAWSLEDTF